MPAKRKRPSCEQCGSAANVVPVIAGEPTLEAEELAHRGEAVLWGCGIMDGLPAWHCKACGSDLDAGRLELGRELPA